MVDQLTGRRVFITGGAGFIGSHLVERLAATNEVTVYDNYLRDAIGHLAGAAERARIVRGDVLDRAALETAMRGHDIVVHLAAIVGARIVGNDALRTLTVNFEGTHACLEAAAANGVRRAVVFSTSEVNGNQATWVREDEPTSIGPATEGRWAYAASKMAIEHMALAYQRRGSLEAVVIRPFNIYGPRQVGEGAVHDMGLAALGGKPITLYGSGTQIRSWCYIDDFIDGVVAAVGRPAAAGEIFNVGNPNETVTNLDLARLILQLTGSTAGWIAKPLTVPEIYLRMPSIEKARRMLAFDPRITLAEGVRRTIEWQRTLAEPALS